MEESKADESTLQIPNDDEKLLQENQFDEKTRYLISRDQDRHNTGEDEEEEKVERGPVKDNNGYKQEARKNSLFTKPKKLITSTKSVPKRNGRSGSINAPKSTKSSDDVLKRRRQHKRTPQSHIQRVFGSKFKFSEKHLIANMDGEMIKSSVKEIFKLDTLTRENLKMILREGADTNNVLRITDECFEKMVDVLNLPLDSDPEDTDEEPDKIECNRYETPRLPDEEDKENNDKMDIRAHEEKTITVSSAYELSVKNNKLIQAKGCLQSIINFERNQMTEKNTTGQKKYKDNSVMPVSIDEEAQSHHMAGLKNLKTKFKILVEEILKTRAAIHKSQEQHMNPDKIENVDVDTECDINELVKTSAGDCPETFNCLVEAKKPYYKLFLVLTIVAIIAFIVMGCITGSYSYSRYIGPWVIVSRGSASAILGTTGILMFFVSYDVLTYIRSKCKGKCQIWLNHNILIHRFCGYVVTFFSILHTIGHCSGSIRKFSEEKDIQNVNDVTLNHDFDGEKTYWELLFLTIPGSTGIILLVLIAAMAITSMSWFREKYFQIFAYIHVFSFPLFLGLTILHGCEGWFNWGFPLGSVFLAAPIIISTIQFIQKLRTMRKYKFRIADVSISANRKYIMILFIKPKGFEVKHGQYVFLNIPQVSCTEWHPFSVASCPESKFLTLMIKRAGDWTGKLIDTLYEQKKSMMRMDKLNIESYDEKDVFNILHSIYDEIKVKDMMNLNKDHFLYANISKPITSTCETFIGKNVVLVGAGSGIAPFLPLVDEIIRFDLGKSHSYDFNSCTLIFIAREGEQVSWISNYLLHLISTDFINSFLNIQIYITLKKNSETVPSFLFWRAFLLICKNNIEMNFEEPKENSKSSIHSVSCNVEEIKSNKTPLESEKLHTFTFETSPVTLKFGRPNFTKICNRLVAKNEPKYDIYACVPKVLANHLHYVFVKMKKETGIVFNLILESFY
ncbi:unnamed protein product [Moneuplotes crassus]|uniref:FAD-binding FR-type domain-containing protein n=1 Tax=Euplotes crassus TaxID=5936 RepID=A0AAD1XYB0_EUPCR|nr:unnamed protein product [Moneuplotes crassus]